MKKIIVILISMTLLFISTTNMKAQENETLAKNAQGAYVMEYATETIIFKKDELKKLYPASMTKMMGLILFYEALNGHKISLDDIVVASEHASSMGGSQIYLEVGEEMRVNDLLKSICIASANDAMVALGEKIAGSEENFVQKMNEKAEELKLANTHFTNASGLHHTNHYSCAKDMAYISKKLLEVGGSNLLKITSTYEDYIRTDSDQKFWLVNTNKLLRQYNGADGLKTGFTSEALSCISVTSKRNDIRLIAVVMGEPTSKIRNQEVKSILDYGYAMFSKKQLYKKDKTIDVYYEENSKQKKIDLKAEEDIVIIYKKEEDASISSKEIIWLNKALPYKKGDRIAKLQIELNNGKTLTSFLVASQDIDKISFLDIFFTLVSKYL